MQGNRLGRHRHARQAQPRGQGPAGRHALAQMQLLWTQPDGVAESGGVLQGTLQDLRAGQCHFSLAKTHTASLGEFGHLGQHLACQPAREGAEWKQARLVQFFGTELEHFHQTRLIEHRIGIGRTHQTGDSTRHRRRHFGFKHAFVLMARLAQARRQVHQAGHHDAAHGVDAALGRKARRYATNTDDTACSQGNVAHPVQAAGGIDHPAVVDQCLHDFMKNWLKTID